MKSSKNSELGKKGEAIALNYLLEKGFSLVAKNFRYQRAEIDLIMLKNELLIFVEVKYRTRTHYGYPEQAVDKRKQQHLLKVVHFYLEQHAIQTPIRCDTIAITETKAGLEVLHLEDAWGYDAIM